MFRIFWIVSILAVVAAGVSIFSKWLGTTIALAGYTEDASIKKIVIGDNVILAPANAIRFERARRDGITNQLDLYFRWPRLDGYSAVARADFNNTSGARNILFLSFTERMMSRDMSGRFEPIYRSLVLSPGQAGPAGLTLYKFNEKSGYMNEVLVVAARAGKDPFVARCLTGEAAEESLAPCERDVDFGDNLSLTYRFPRQLLEKWEILDNAILTKAYKMRSTQ